MTKLLTRILFISLIVIFIGQVFKIQHYPHGDLISFIGIGSYLIFSLIQIERLKKIIASFNLEDKKTD